MSIPFGRRPSAALLALSLLGLSECHASPKAAGEVGNPVPNPNEKIDGPALATVLLTGDGWGEYAPCG
jgi:hypothetical protein